MPATAAVVAVTGANGFVGARICAALAERGANVRAIVRRPGTAPTLDAVTEVVGDFADPEFAAGVVAGTGAVLTTVHPMGSDRETQRRVGVEGTATLAAAAAAAGVSRLIHISTAAVYDRSPGVGDVGESSALVPDTADDYAVTKRDADLTLAGMEGITRVLLRPPAVLGPGASSTWNALRPAEILTSEAARHAVARKSFPWVHVVDLAALAADLATGRVAETSDPAQGPLAQACTAVNVVAGTDTTADYIRAVTDALGVDPIWDEPPAWTGRLLGDRACRWGWSPTVTLADGLAEIAAGLRG